MNDKSIALRLREVRRVFVQVENAIFPSLHLVVFYDNFVYGVKGSLGIIENHEQILLHVFGIDKCT